jgi:hypothetical protein
LLASEFSNDSIEARSKYMSTRAGLSENVKFSSDEQGLLRINNPDMTKLVAGLGDEFYVYKDGGEIKTVIRCDGSAQSGEPKNIDSPRKVASCEQEFFGSSGDGLRLSLHYQRIHLSNWRQIQTEVTSLLASFLR